MLKYNYSIDLFGKEEIATGIIEADSVNDAHLQIVNNIFDNVSIIPEVPPRLFHFIIPAEDMEPEEDMGWYYINATERQITKEVRKFLDRIHEENTGEDFNEFIKQLKKKYNVEEYKVPYHYVIKY